MGGRAQDQNSSPYLNQNDQGYDFSGPSSQHNRRLISLPMQRDRLPKITNEVPLRLDQADQRLQSVRHDSS